jgi:hypothetical protein
MINKRFMLLASPIGETDTKLTQAILDETNSGIQLDEPMTEREDGFMFYGHGVDFHENVWGRFVRMYLGDDGKKYIEFSEDDYVDSADGAQNRVDKSFEESDKLFKKIAENTDAVYTPCVTKKSDRITEFTNDILFPLSFFDFAETADHLKSFLGECSFESQEAIHASINAHVLTNKAA